jgi:putative membrane protein
MTHNDSQQPDSTHPDIALSEAFQPEALQPTQQASPGLWSDLRLLTPSERSLWRLPLMWAAAVAILFIPVVYVAVYLGSVWNPYGNLKKLPVALVNLDVGIDYGGKNYNLGGDLIQQFHEDPPVKFVRYQSERLAQQAVRRGEVYFALTLPADFSAHAIAGNSSEHGLLRLYSAEGTSYFASRVGSSIATTLASNLNERLSSTRWTKVQKSLVEVQQGFADLRAGVTKLKDGAGTLVTGTGKLESGAQNLASGASRAAGGSQQLSQGAQSLSGGVGTLTSGVAQLSSGIGQLSAQAPGQQKLQSLQAGVAALAQGNANLTGGLGKLSAGGAQLSGGAQTLNAGATKVDAGARQLSAQLPGLATGLGQLGGGAQTLAKGAGNLNSGARQLGGGIKGLGAQVTQLGLTATQLAALQGGTSKLQSGADNLSQGAAQLQGGANSLAQNLAVAQTGAQKAAAEATQLALGTAQLQAGSAQLQRGAASLAENLSGAQAGAAKLSQGATDLSAGMDKLVAGNLKIKAALGSIESKLPAQADLDRLSTGALTLAQKSGELATGLGTLNTGAGRLAAGAGDVNAGAIKLQGGLNTLYSKIPASIEQLSGDPSGLSASVQVMTQTTASVANNGAAFAPYFIALSLWVGCTLTTFIFPYLLIAQSARHTRQSARVLRKFALPAAYVVAQALVVVWGVHLLGVEFLHPGLVVLTAVAASLTFMLLVLALNLLLGAAGRLLALVLLVIQLAASGGSYPVELSSPFFQWLHTYIPVTDAINAMRYAMFGSYEGLYGLFMVRLALIALVSLGVALLSRRRWQYIADERFRSPLVLDVG